MSSYPPYHEGFQNVEKITGICIPLVLLIPNQIGVHCIFSSYTPWRGPQKQSPWDASLREGGGFDTFSHMSLVLQWQPAICRKDSYCKKDPSQPTSTTVGTLVLYRRPNTLSRASREACSAKPKEKGRKRPSLSTPSGASSDWKYWPTVVIKSPISAVLKQGRSLHTTQSTSFTCS